jgi:hypothetical protein
MSEIKIHGNVMFLTHLGITNQYNWQVVIKKGSSPLTAEEK